MKDKIFALKYFNSQPHEEADSLSGDSNISYDISTHSLTRRLTNKEPIVLPSDAFQLTASRGG